MMTGLPFLDALARAVAGWLLTYAIHSTILLGVALLLAVRLREQHAWLDWVWKVALTGAVITATAHGAIGMRPLGGVWWPWPAAAATAERGTGLEDPGLLDAGSSGRARDERNGVVAAEDAPALGSDPTAGSAAGTATDCCGIEASVRVAGGGGAGALSVGAMGRRTIAFLKVSWPTVLVVTWLLLAVVGVTRFVRRQRALNRVLEGRRPVYDEELRRAVEELCEAGGLRRALRLSATRRCPVPVALLGGEIVVPERFLTELDYEQQRAALAHEVAHQVRRDPQWLLLAHLLEAIFFFQPLQRQACRALRASAEVLCDDWAVQQTFSLVVARCLAAVAAWVTPAAEWQLAAASGMACGDSALVQRVERVLRPERERRPRRVMAAATLLTLPLLLLLAPVVSSADIPTTAPTLYLRAAEQRATRTDAQASPLAAAPQPEQVDGQEGVIRSPRPADPLEARWAWALDEAARRGLRGFWIAYSFYRPAARDRQFISDSHGVHFDDRLLGSAPLHAVLDGTRPIGGRGNIGALFHFAGADDRHIDRIGHRSLSLGFDFADEPVFWLGYVDEPQSLARLEDVFASVAARALRGEVVEAYGLHPTTDRVLPFLTRVLRQETSASVRAEAAESLEHHSDPRVVQLLVRTARTDGSPHVRTEATEALGELNVREALPALLDLAQNSTDARVRAEAAEAIGEQPPERAVPALRRLIDASADPHVRLEAVEALGELRTREAADALVRIIWEHGSPEVRRESVETLAEYRAFGIVEQLDRILREHRDERVREEALDVLAELNDARAEQRIAHAARTSSSAHIRREALQLLGDAQEEDGDRRAGALSAEQLATLLERAIFEDRDRSVQLEALDVAAESLPPALARRLLRRVANEHPVRAVRAEALDELEDID